MGDVKLTTKLLLLNRKELDLVDLSFLASGTTVYVWTILAPLVQDLVHHNYNLLSIDETFLSLLSLTTALLYISGRNSNSFDRKLPES